MPTVHRDGIEFFYRRTGQGLPFFFQHGLGADVEQPFGLLTPPKGIELLSFDCRCHGQTRPVGDQNRISLPAFAEDLLALMDHLGIGRAIIGGSSMGAAVTLNFVLRFPQRAIGLVLSRPAWLESVSPFAGQVLPEIARLTRTHGTQRGKELFMQSDVYKRTLERTPDTANSLAGQFDHPRAQETAVKLQRIPASRPCDDLSQLRKIAVPTLVMANRLDPIHPFEFGTKLAELIPGAEFRELASKSVDKRLHEQQVQQFVADFLTRHFLRKDEHHA